MLPESASRRPARRADIDSVSTVAPTDWGSRTLIFDRENRHRHLAASPFLSAVIPARTRSRRRSSLPFDTQQEETGRPGLSLASLTVLQSGHLAKPPVCHRRIKGGIRTEEVRRPKVWCLGTTIARFYTRPSASRLQRVQPTASHSPVSLSLAPFPVAEASYPWTGARAVNQRPSARSHTSVLQALQLAVQSSGSEPDR